MTDLLSRDAERRLDAALRGLAATFRGATAAPEEVNCECHWGSAEELALLKVPDVELAPDLLRRTWQAPDWDDHAAVLRRILPQLARDLTDIGSESFQYQEEIGQSFARACWQEWPAEQVASVREFLWAFWMRNLVAADAHAHEALVLCVEVSGELRPWLDAWEDLDHPAADRNLVEAIADWSHALLLDELPWISRYDEVDLLAVLTAWLTGHAPGRLRAGNAPNDLLQRLRLVGLSGGDRWDDPHWPRHNPLTETQDHGPAPTAATN
ncbi:hypothetical protein [Streptomyces sp. NPDC002185]|uniref:hypothetical protein n=1 Tax=unclassified Streptomyces TaxID=2593676 RepID=UPI003688A0BC